MSSSKRYSVHPMGVDMEGSTSQVNQSNKSLPSSQNNQPDIENPGRCSPMSVPPLKARHFKCLSVLRSINIFEKIPYPIYLLVLLVLSPVIYACVTAATVGILPLFIASFVLARVIQLVIKSENFERHFVVKVLMRYWMFAVVVLLLLEAGIFYPIAKYVTWFKIRTIVGLSITKWIEIICMLSGIYLLSQVAWLFIVYIITSIVVDQGGTATLVLEAVSEIVGCVLFRWAESVVMHRVPVFSQSIIFGVYTRKWIRVSLFMLIGYNVITLLTHAFVWLLPQFYGDKLGNIGGGVLSSFCCIDLIAKFLKKRYVVYVACGLKRSIIFILSSLMLLLTWVLHIGDYLNKSDSSPEDKKFFTFGTWTFVIILIWSLLWLIKSCVLLYWEAQAVHERLQTNISKIGKQLYILVMLSNDHYVRTTTHGRSEREDDQPTCPLSCYNCTPPIEKKRWGDFEVETLDREKVKKRLTDGRKPEDVSIYEIQRAIDIFSAAQDTLSKGSILDNLNHLHGDYSVEIDKLTTEKLKRIIQGAEEGYSEEDLQLLLELLQDAPISSKEITIETVVKTWMERAHNRCSSLANTLSSEKELSNCLNRILCSAIIVVIVIIWLLATKLATTEVLVLIASPLLALTFVFGDTCKSFFQGLTFIYIVHPYDVGDLCLIDEKLLEVKGIGVWTTTFSNVRAMGTKQQVIQPNSVLATKNVINHKSDFDWNDYLEFCLPGANGKTAKKVIDDIEKHIEAKMDSEGTNKKYVESFHSAEFKEVGDKAKIAVHVKYNIKSEGWTYFECLKMKEKQRNEFAVYLQDIVDKYDPKPQALVVSMSQTGHQVPSDSTSTRA